MKINHRNPWSKRRPATLPILSFQIGADRVGAIDLGSERHLADKVRTYMSKVHQHLRDRKTE